MNSIPMLFAALVLLPAAALVAFAWYAMTQVEAELRSFTGLGGFRL